MISNSTPLTKENMDFLLNNIKKVDPINPQYFEKYNVKNKKKNINIPLYFILLLVYIRFNNVYTPSIIQICL